MRLEREALKEFVIEAALLRFGNRVFRRRDLIECAEEALRRSNLWEAGDDTPSQSTDPKSLGRANIDFTISALSQESRLRHLGRDEWRVPARYWARSNGSKANGSVPSQIEDRLRKLEAVTARIQGPAIPLDALRREELYRDRG